ncbi:hypothetical protein KR059_007324 [Drosophila kikkawai]|nr:hypothetical protein KR059_007324 [Drosophila kikkawai]
MSFLWRVFLALCLIVVLESGLGSNSPQYCTTYDEKPGRCLRFQDCPYILKVVNKVIQGKALTSREKEIRENSYQPCHKIKKTICCADPVNHRGLKLLKEEDANCGIFEELLVMGGVEVRMGSRPWMALLKYGGFPYRESFRCGATVITPLPDFCRYSVRLGEHNIMTQKDCAAYGKEVFCQPRYQDVEVHSFVIHPDFNPITGHNDIALIRLVRKIDTSRFTPICLPIYDQVQQKIRSSTEQWVTGWGLFGKELSDVLREAQVKRLPHNCRSSLIDSQLCVTALGNDSCRGDSGGPLAYPYFYKGSQRIVQTGIVSKGPSPCGKSKSAIYTDVTKFVPWITQNIKA